MFSQCIRPYIPENSRKADVYHIKLIIMISFTFGQDSTDAIEANGRWLQIHHDSVDTSVSTKAQSRIYATRNYEPVSKM